MTVAPTAVGNGNLALPYASRPQSYVVKRCFFPSHGRLSPRINHRLENGEQFVGFIWSFWWGRSAPSSCTRSRPRVEVERKLRTRADLSGSELPSQLPYAAATTTL